MLSLLLFNAGDVFGGTLKSSESSILAYQSGFASASACQYSNFVMNPLSVERLPHAIFKNETRRWSMIKSTYGRFQNSTQFCSTTAELLDSLRFGMRTAEGDENFSSVLHHKHWEELGNGTAFYDASLAMESRPSLFRPHGCLYRWYSPSSACALLGRIGKLVLIGDSLTRHILAALKIILSGDYQRGALPVHFGNHTLYEQCRCDGQFSENRFCETEIDCPTNAGCELCDPAIPPFGIHAYVGGHNSAEWFLNPRSHSSEIFCSNDSRPVVVYLQGGAHFSTNASETIREFLDPVMQHISVVLASCPAVRVHYVWGSMHTQSVALNARYPRQANERMLIFNKEMREYVSSTYSFTDIFDYANLTANAMKSDGFHQLQDVNMVKASYLLTYVNLRVS